MSEIYGVINITNKMDKEKIYSIITNNNQNYTTNSLSEQVAFVSDDSCFGIKDLKQLIYNEENSLFIICDGIIYNYKSLRKELEEKGHIFTTQIQSEVVLHCFEQYGTEGFNKLHGKYSFVIYDLRHKKAIIARDMAGQKPLYYYHDEEIFIFSSNLKSVLYSGVIKKEINKKALNQYLQLTYIPAPLTIYKNIFKLLPGHYMILDSSGNANIQKYWDVVYEHGELIQDYNKCKKLLRTTLFNAVEESMDTDLSIGSFLSGGIDSTIITGIASHISNKPLKTFTIGYKDKRFDERDRAKLSSDLHKTHQNIFILEYEEVLPELNKIISSLDEPFADSSYIPTYMVSKYAKESVDIVLTGDAGDEIFGGYSKYLIGYYSEQYNRIPKLYRNVFENMIKSMPDNSSLTRKIRKVIDNSGNDIFTQRKNLMCLGFKEDELLLLLNKDFMELDSLDIIDEYYYSQKNAADELSKALYTDFKVVIEGDMMPKGRIASNLMSLETRSPMLHKDIVELAAIIPNKFKINTKNTKLILKDTFKDLIPRELLTASKKGFAVPIGNWFRDELKEDLLVELNEKRIKEQGIFNYGYIEKILNEHFKMIKDRSSELWALYVFLKWYATCYT